MSDDYRNAITMIKDAYDLADYIRSTGIAVQPNGVGKWKALCPFHADKSPSMIINDSFQNYKCWACGAFGDLLEFVQKQENLSFVETLKKLAADRGIDLDLGDNESTVDYQSLQLILKAAANFYIKQFNELPKEHKAKEEILSRGLTWNNREKDGLYYGYAPSGNQLVKHLKSQGFSEELIKEAGLAGEKNGRYFDFFHSRLMFVFTDRHGKPIGFSSRKLFEDDPRPGKYINSPETPLFKKSRVLYNHPTARKAAGQSKTLYVVEGQFDVAAVRTSGLGEVVAASGTAFTKEHGAECSKMVGTKGRVIFCFDGDEAGLKAAQRIFINLPELHDQAYVKVFPEGQDPCDYRQQNSSDELKEYLENDQKSLVEFMILQARRSYDLTSVVGRSQYVTEGASIVKTVRNLTLRENVLKLLSLESFVPIDTVREAVDQAKPMVDTSEETSVVEDVVGDSKDDEQQTDGLEQNEQLAEEEQRSLADELEQLVRNDPRFNISSRFISLGMQNVTWRGALVRSKELIPEELHPFLENLDKISQERLYPELFEDVALASVFMKDSFSTFYKFMEKDELKEHFIYLHSRLEEMNAATKRSSEIAHIKQLLAQDQDESWEYYVGVRARIDEALLSAPQ